MTGSYRIRGKMIGFIVVFFIVVHSSTIAQTVCIPDSVASYFLEQDDRVKILTKKDSLSQQLISDLQLSVDTRDLYITTLQNTNKALTGINGTKDKQLLLKDEEIKLAKKEIKRQKFQKVLTMVGSGLIIILIIL